MDRTNKNQDKFFFINQIFPNATNTYGETLVSSEKVNVMSALAHNELFQEEVAKNFEVTNKIEFRDHHAYTQNDIDGVWDNAKSLPIITTEKDFVKLKELLTENQLQSFYVLKLEANFLENEAAFLRNVKNDFKRFQARKGSLNNG